MIKIIMTFQRIFSGVYEILKVFENLLFKMYTILLSFWITDMSPVALEYVLSKVPTRVQSFTVYGKKSSINF